MRLVNEERMLEIYDPGSGVTANPAGDDGVIEPSDQDVQGLLYRTWDEVCAEFASINLNWDSQRLPSTEIRHWWAYLPVS